MNVNVEQALLNIKVFNRKHHRETFDLAIDALEKQIPKKPIITKFGNGAEKINCGKCYLGSHITRAVDYCPHCGTKIDWEDN